VLGGGALPAVVGGNVPATVVGTVDGGVVLGPLVEGRRTSVVRGTVRRVVAGAVLGSVGGAVKTGGAAVVGGAVATWAGGRGAARPTDGMANAAASTAAEPMAHTRARVPSRARGLGTDGVDTTAV